MYTWDLSSPTLFQQVLFFLFVGIPVHETMHKLSRRRVVAQLLPFLLLSMVPTRIALALHESRSPLAMNHFDPYTPKLAVFALLNGVYSSVDLTKVFQRIKAKP